MGAADLDVIAAACERMRRLPASRWQLPPVAPMGSRPPGSSIDRSGPTLEQSVRAGIDRLMADDARARGVSAFAPQVAALSLPDVLLALAVSVALRGDDAGDAALADAAASARNW